MLVPLLALLEGARGGSLPEESKTPLGAETSHEVPLSKFLTAFVSRAVNFWGSCSLSSYGAFPLLSWLH